MRRLIPAALWLVPVFLLLASRISAPAAAPRVFTDADQGATVQLKAGESFEVRLKSNPTTGYGWTVDLKSTPLVKLTGQSHTEPGQPGAIGRPIVQVFHFQAVGRGEGALLLRYTRPWEKPSAGDEQFSLHVSIR